MTEIEQLKKDLKQHIHNLSFASMRKRFIQDHQLDEYIYIDRIILENELKLCKQIVKIGPTILLTDNDQMIREIGKIFASGHVTSMLISRQITFDQFEEHINQQIEDLKQKESEAKQKLDQIAKIKKSIEYKTR